MSRAALLGLWLALALGCGGGADGSASEGRYQMGTVLELRLEGVGAPAGRELLERLFARVAELEQLFTRFHPQSALSRLNLAAGSGPQPVAPDLALLLDRSLVWSRRTQGAFDVTVGPLVELWALAAERGRAPSPAELERARRSVGAGQLHVDLERGTAALAGGASVDLGGIAKGYALDQLVQMVTEARVSSALLSFGGSSVHALGSAPDAEAWQVALRDARGGIGPVLGLRDRALSVSGSLGQSREIEGRLYGHVIDPRSGLALSRERVAAVVAVTGTDAEALSKALLVLGADEALALAESLPGVEAWLSETDGTERSTSGFAALCGPGAPGAADDRGAPRRAAGSGASGNEPQGPPGSARVARRRYTTTASPGTVCRR